jgi:hypothetical protein
MELMAELCPSGRDESVRSVAKKRVARAAAQEG